jgi:transcriptional regulator with XRE-family HTH domain
MAIGRRIESSRKARHLTVPLLADRAGLSVDELQRLEVGAVSPITFELLEKVARALEAPMAELLSDMEPPEPVEAEASIDERRAQLIASLDQALRDLLDDEERQNARVPLRLIAALVQIAFSGPRPQTTEQWRSALNAIRTATTPKASSR